MWTDCRTKNREYKQKYEIVKTLFGEKKKPIKQPHNRCMSNKCKDEYFKEKYTELVDRPIKYRYVFFNTNRRRKKQLLNKLVYNIYDYPKTTNIDEMKEKLWDI